jgi:site-specific DNA recombinase
MSPSHANKKGVRYRYYVSQALLQSRKTEAGSISRVSAPDFEALVCRALKEAGRTDPETAQSGNDVTDHELISQHVERVMVYPDWIAVTLCCTETGSRQSDTEAGTTSSMNLMIPFTPKLLRQIVCVLASVMKTWRKNWGSRYKRCDRRGSQPKQKRTDRRRWIGSAR